MKLSDLYQWNPHLPEVCYTSIITNNACDVDHLLLCSNAGRTNPQEHYYPSSSQKDDEPEVNNALFGMFPVHCDMEHFTSSSSSSSSSSFMQWPPSRKVRWQVVGGGDNNKNTKNNDNNNNLLEFPPAPRTSCTPPGSKKQQSAQVLVMPTIYSTRKPVLSPDDMSLSEPSCITSTIGTTTTTTSTPSNSHGYTYEYKFCHEESFTVQQQSTNNKTLKQWKWDYTGGPIRLYPHNHIPMATAQPFQLTEWMAKDMMQQHFVFVEGQEDGNDNEKKKGGNLKTKNEMKLTVQWQCCDNNNNNDNQNSTAATTAPIYLSGDIHLKSSRHPERGSKIILCTPKMCANFRHHIDSRFHREAALGWLLDYLVLRISDLVVRLVTVSASSASSSSLQTTNIDNQQMGADTTKTTKTNRAIAVAKNFLELCLFTLMDSLDGGGLALINSEGDVLYTFRPEEEVAADERHTVAALNSISQEITKVSDTMLQHESYKKRSASWRKLMQHVHSVTTTNNTSTSPSSPSSLALLLAHKRAMEENQNLTQSMCHRKKENAPCAVVDSIPISLYYYHNDEDYDGNGDDNDEQGLHGYKETFPRRPNDESFFNPNKNTPSYYTPTKKTNIGVKMANSCLWKHYNSRTLPSDQCLEAMSTCHTTLIETYNYALQMERRKRQIKAGQSIHLYATILTILRFFVVKADTKRKQKPKWKRLRQMLDDPVLARGMQREAEERLGSAEAAELHMRELEDRAIQDQQEEEAKINHNVDKSNTNNGINDDNEATAKMLLPQTDLLKSTISHGISLSIFHGCLTFSNMLPFVGLLVGFVSGIVASVVMNHRKSPWQLHHKSLTHLKDDIRSLNQRIAVSHAILLMDTMTFRPEPAASTIFLQSIRHVAVLVIFVFLQLYVIRRISQALHHHHQSHHEELISSTELTSLRIDQTDAAAPLLDPLTLRKRGG